MFSSYQKDRQLKLHEYVTTTHMLCVLIMISGLILNKRLFPFLGSTNYSNIYGIALAILIALLVIVFYSKRLQRDINSYPIFNISDLIYIFFPVIISGFTLFIISDEIKYAEIVLLLPIIITASIMGKSLGLWMSLICTIVLLVFNIKYDAAISMYEVFEHMLLPTSIMFVVGWYIGGFTDVENEYKRKLVTLANTDMLTGLFNHRYFQERIKNEITKIDKEPLSLLFIDIDYFKHYNDCFGHQAGDAVLSVVGNILKNYSNDNGFAARYGGEEFVLVLPGTTGEQAAVVAEKIRTEINSYKFDGKEYQPGGSITVSCGIATAPDHATNIKDLIKFADMALYRAKSQNKDKVELYFSVLGGLEFDDNEKEFINSIRTLNSIIDAKDRYTHGHSERVTVYCTKLAELIGMDAEKIKTLRFAAFLHDVGKIEIERDILNKVGRLNPQEWQILKQHPIWGSDIVKAFKKLDIAATAVLYHHENFDGSGYPYGIQGSDIPVYSRIIRIADSYDAMITNRPYKKSMEPFEALNELELCSGTLFDPELTEKFINMIKAQLGDEKEPKFEVGSQKVHGNRRPR